MTSLAWQRCTRAREALAGAGMLVEWHIRPGLGHGIDREGQWLAGNFMVQVLRPETMHF